MRDNQRPRRTGAEVVMAGSGDALPQTTPTVADAVERHLLLLLQNPMANVGNLKGWTDDLRNALKNLGVLHGLQPEQQQELSDLVTRLLAIEDTFPELKPRARERQQWSRRGVGYVKNVMAKTRAAGKAVTDLRKYLNKIGVAMAHVDSALNTSLAVLDVATLRDLPPRVSILLGEISDRSRQPTDDVLVTLHGWFVKSGIPQGEAECRVGTISNEYWDTHFQVTERNSDGEKSRGCDAVRRRIERRRKRDTPNTSA